MILLIDNYDSFSYNLFQIIGTFNDDIKVIRNDEMTTDEIESVSPTHIIISPGPGYPKDAGISIETVKKLGNKISEFLKYILFLSKLQKPLNKVEEKLLYIVRLLCICS